MNKQVKRDLERLRERIDDDDEDLTDEDRETLTALDSSIIATNARESRFGPYRHFEVLAACFRIAAGTGELARTLEEPPEGTQAVNKVVQWIDAKDLSGYAVDDYHSALRSFATLMLDLDPDSDDLPDRFASLKTSHRDNDPTPSQADIVHWQEAADLADVKEQYNYRDPALIAIQWSTGARPLSELWELTWGDIEDRGDHFLFSIPEDTKTGSRDVRVYVGAPYLRRWRENHPAHDDGGLDGDTYLWTSTTKNKHISYTMYREVFSDAADRLGFTKPVTPQNFRRSRASVLASKPSMNQVDLENHFGWKRGSDSAAHYISAFAGETGKHVAMADGHPVDKDDKDDAIAPVKCLDCGEYTPRHRDECLWCPTPVEASLGEQESLEHYTEDGDADLLEMVMDGEVAADDLRAVKRLESVIRREPEKLFGRVDELIELTERYNHG